MPDAVFQRVLIKLSGEVLAGDKGFGIEPKSIHKIATEIREICALNIQLALVIGGGNIFRGISASAEGVDRASADYMGMLATVINSLALQDALERQEIPTRVLSAIQMRQVAEPYIKRRAIRHLEKLPEIRKEYGLQGQRAFSKHTVNYALDRILYGLSV